MNSLFRYSVTVVCLTVFIQSVPAADITGKVTEVTGTTVKVTLEGNQAPKIGDSVEFYFSIPGLEESVTTGKGTVLTVEGSLISATITDGAEKIVAGQLARIKSGTVPPGSPTQNPGDASGNLGLEVGQLAEDIAALLKKYELSEVAVGQFTGPAHIPSSSGPAITNTLIEQLEKHHIKVPRFRAMMEIKGDYLDVVDKKTGKPAVLIKVRIIDRSGQVVEELQRGVFGQETMAQVFGLTVDLPPDQPESTNDDTILVSIDKPKAHLVGTRVMAGSGSPYGLEVLVKSGSQYVNRSPIDEEGFAFVDVQRGESYAIRLINDSDHDAAVKLTIDGLNMFTFSDDPRYKASGIVIIPAGSTGTIKGWHRNNLQSDEFLVTEYGKSEAAKIHTESGIGTVTATFHAAWVPGSPPPDDEAALVASRSANATGRGPTTDAKFTDAQRVIGTFRASVSVRYSK